VQESPAGTVVIKTNDGRKRFTFPTHDLMRVDEIDNKQSMITLFKRAPSAPPTASASAAASSSAPVAPSASASKPKP
jgi:hypothetical protein